MKTEVKVLHAEWTREALRALCKFGKSTDEAFGADATLSLQLPWMVLGSGTDWCWFEWQLNPVFAPISQALGFMVRRSIEALNRARPDAFLRTVHDRMILECAALSGDRETMRKAAETVIPANPDVRENRYEQAWNGILRARMLNEPEQERKQLELLDTGKPVGLGAYPSRALLKSFVARDYKALAKAVEGGAEKYWGKQFLPRGKAAGIVIKEEPGKMTLDLRFKDKEFYWPRIEAVFAKLALLDGAQITYDSFWFPLEFVKAMRE